MSDPRAPETTFEDFFAVADLNPELSAEVLATIRRLADIGRTMILVTHEMSFARQVSSQVLFLHQGRIEEQGTAQILDQPRSERLQQFLSNRLK